jgi:hypothetical protein
MRTSAFGMSRTARALAVVAMATTTAWAIQPGQWLHTTEADFEPGERDGTIVTNLGDVKLAGATQVLAEMPEQASILYDMLAAEDGGVYLAAGPEAKLLIWRDEKVEELLSLPGEQIFTLATLDESLLVGVSAEGKSRLAMWHDDKLVEVAALPDVRYVWDMLVSDGDVFLATGTEGQVLRIADVAGRVAAVRDGRELEAAATSVVLDATPANILCLGIDGQKRLYAGTDGDGLIYRLTPRAAAEGEAEGGYEAFVLYDASEPEIGAILVLADGTVYAGTADADQAKPGRLSGAAEQEAGRPGAAEGEAEPPAAPDAGEGEPGEAPDPGDLPQVPPRAPPVGEPETAPADDHDAAEPQALQLPEAQARPAPAAMADAPAGEAAPATPSPEQYDRLRAVIRQRLEQARQTGALQAGRPMQAQRRPAAPGARPGAAPRPTAAPPKEGNAVYRIDTQGFVTEVFRESVMILKLVEVDGKLLVATGNEGQLYRVDPAADETTTLVDLDPQQIPSILRGPDGSILLGTANPASVVRLDEGFAQRGDFTSVVLDAGQISLWGKLHLTGDLPMDTTVTVQTRSGNVQNVEDAAWSPWAVAGKFAFDPNLPRTIALEPREITVASPPARFLQYRLLLEGDGKATPSVGRIRMAYVTPNLRPSITAITAQYPDAAPAGGPGRPGTPPAVADTPPATAMAVNWEAADPNGDRLLFNLEYQPAGSDIWLPLAQDLDANSYEWQTRHVPDGRYLIRVTASDRPDNPPDMAKTANRVSDPVVIDNTPPAFVNVRFERDGANLTIEGEVRDALTPIRSIQYNLDGAERFEAVLPVDLIFDSTRETFVVKISDLSPGPHVVTLRATDGRGHTVYEAVLID